MEDRTSRFKRGRRLSIPGMMETWHNKGEDGRRRRIGMQLNLVSIMNMIPPPTSIMAQLYVGCWWWILDVNRQLTRWGLHKNNWACYSTFIIFQEVLYIGCKGFWKNISINPTLTILRLIDVSTLPLSCMVLMHSKVVPSTVVFYYQINMQGFFALCWNNVMCSWYDSH